MSANRRAWRRWDDVEERHLAEAVQKHGSKVGDFSFPVKYEV